MERKTRACVRGAEVLLPDNLVPGRGSERRGREKEREGASGAGEEGEVNRIHDRLHLTAVDIGP
jgi:hypothetical protein